MYGVGVPETLVEVSGSDAGKRLGRITKARWAGGFYKKARLRCVSLATVLREQNTLPKDRRLPSTFF